MRTVRGMWRWLTSMRTALLLLLLLAIAAVPGSVWPQRGVSAENVNAYLRQHPGSGPWLDRFSFFDVYSSPWFSAIYLLLFVSLVGCLVPRLRQHLGNIVSSRADAPAPLGAPPPLGARADPQRPPHHRCRQRPRHQPPRRRQPRRRQSRHHRRPR